MVQFDLFYWAGRPTELISQPRGFNLVFLFLKITVLGMSFPLGMPGHGLQVTQATVLMSWTPGQCIPTCWATEYMHTQVGNKRKVKIFCWYKKYHQYTSVINDVHSHRSCCLSMVLICISLIINEVKHLLLYLWSICFSSAKCLFISLPIFLLNYLSFSCQCLKT